MIPLFTGPVTHVIGPAISTPIVSISFETLLPFVVAGMAVAATVLVDRLRNRRPRNARLVIAHTMSKQNAA